MSLSASSQDGKRHGSLPWLRMAMSTLLVAVFLLAAWKGHGFATRASYLPLVASYLGATLSLVALWQEFQRGLRRATREGMVEEAVVPPVASEPPRVEGKAVARNFTWLVGYVVLVRILVLPAASALFVLVFLRREADFRWRWCVPCALGTGLVLVLVRTRLRLRWPESVFDPLQYFLG